MCRQPLGRLHLARRVGYQVNRPLVCRRPLGRLHLARRVGYQVNHPHVPQLQHPLHLACRAGCQFHPPRDSELSPKLRLLEELCRNEALCLFFPHVFAFTMSSIFFVCRKWWRPILEVRIRTINVLRALLIPLWRLRTCFDGEGKIRRRYFPTLQAECPLAHSLIQTPSSGPHLPSCPAGPCLLFLRLDLISLSCFTFSAPLLQAMSFFSQRGHPGVLLRFVSLVSQFRNRGSHKMTKMHGLH